ncbi:MAG TPA: hypothetical protein VN658_07735 [Candidatus Acidoferrales bacterium]|nr:hypothetical protein [Candidatus Acidoferrales bacterium]
MEIIANSAYAKDKDEEIKGIKRPAKKAGNEGIPLNGSKIPQTRQHAHFRLLELAIDLPCQLLWKSRKPGSTHPCKMPGKGARLALLM